MRLTEQQKIWGALKKSGDGLGKAILIQDECQI